ncbi:S-adenosyl-methyltransferase MraW [Spiroplasma sabaudiense Ar-1343]|uniref:Ribosomal RNA small subunit methyltransferase H n=2 Tax=Spiroplasma sabaudiense TaxID=216944 RepID=W6AA02_9MOLU|nr:16S rRNA (cytosine(1402)-N(4))-methyltransferase RsmH [Spiroplasma sabaudiense]AHI54008.1 S-adenosyl-methyltransferase MraW [Spiroplasma sabaudiense Ar-1343]
MQEHHVSVLLNEAIDFLNVKKSGIYVDATLGRAGHSKEILKCLTTGKLFAIDQDETAINYSQPILEKISENFKILKGNFRDLESLLAFQGVFEVDGILFDLGVSSPQFDNKDRGFSYRFDSELDMRMDQKSNQLTAKSIVNNWSLSDLIRIFRDFGEETYAVKIANRIIEARAIKEIQTTFELVEIIKSGLPQKVLKEKKHPAKKIFQALRICVNNELEVLKDALKSSLKLLKSGGTLVVITFQSLEEKIVKEIFKGVTIFEEDKILAKLPINVPSKSLFELVNKKPFKPRELELENNRRAHSAKLWAIKKK